MAEAYDMSYGQYRLYVSEGWMLPPKKHPIKWPKGSKYAKKREIKSPAASGSQWGGQKRLIF